MPDWIQVETRGGVPISYEGNTITPFTQTVRVQFPFMKGGLIWNRPVSVLTVSPDGKEEIVKVNDVTRQVQWALLGTAAVTGVFYWLISKNRSR